MTAHLPDPSPTLPPAALIQALIRGEVPSLPGARMTRMHFPSSRAPNAQIGPLNGGWIAEWLGPDAHDRAAAEAERLERAGQTATLRWDARSGLLLRRPGVDAKLSGLRLLTDPALAARTLSELGLRGPFSVELVAHRLGRRAVLRIRHAGGWAFARLRAPGGRAARLAVAQHAALWSAARDLPALRLPEPLGGDEALGLSLYAALPGRGMPLRGLPGFAATEAAAQALRSLQRVAVEAPLWTAEDEIALLRRWLDRVASIFPDLSAAISPRLERLGSELRDLPEAAPVTLHRDLHEGQILVFRGRAGLLDFDTLSRGDPALDLGNLQAHLDLAGLRAGVNLAAYSTAAERIFPEVPLARMAVWRRAARLRLAMIWAFSPEPRGHLLSLIEVEE